MCSGGKDKGIQVQVGSEELEVSVQGSKPVSAPQSSSAFLFANLSNFMIQVLSYTSLQIFAFCTLASGMYFT